MMTEPLEERTQDTDPAATARQDCSTIKDNSHSRGLLLIGIFKLSKSLFFFAVGVGALHLVHKNVGELLLRVASMLHFDPEGQFIGMLQDKADLISGHQLRQLSLATFGYSALSLVEGIGLMMEKTWAEYLTLTLTICALPYEMYEMIRRPTTIHAGLLLVNVAVLAYLLWFIRRHRRQQRACEAGS